LEHAPRRLKAFPNLVGEARPEAHSSRRRQADVSPEVSIPSVTPRSVSPALARAFLRAAAARSGRNAERLRLEKSAMFFLVFARRQEKSRAKCVRVGASGRRPERWNRVCARGQTLSRALNRARAFRGVPMTPRRLRRRSSFSRTFLSRLSSFFSQFARRPQVLLAVSTLWVARCARISPPRLRARSRATPAPLRRLPTRRGRARVPTPAAPSGCRTARWNRPVGEKTPITDPETRRMMFRFVTFFFFVRD
jgi:hypothetical protein